MMSNHFPSPASDLSLAIIQYQVTIGADPTPVSGTALAFTGGFIAMDLPYGGNPVGVSFQFDTPGEFGTFDQDAAETAIKAFVTDACQTITDISGRTLASAQATVVISRSWAWRDSTGAAQQNFTDTLAYP